jgi:hypothetical protein
MSQDSTQLLYGPVSTQIPLGRTLSPLEGGSANKIEPTQTQLFFIILYNMILKNQKNYKKKKKTSPN